MARQVELICCLNEYLSSNITPMFLADWAGTITLEQIFSSDIGQDEWSNFERITITSVLESFSFNLFWVIHSLVSRPCNFTIATAVLLNIIIVRVRPHFTSIFHSNTRSCRFRTNEFMFYIFILQNLLQ